ncbi:Enoyl-CoA hydratase/isomerase [Isosphaera pallida ATCC 43644]|jgi:methylglutaconyl-CoA hydratase|uniref:Enoyl-CoA hydratase/isomerase n=1 Tax=Isosphaera pallida (strain ATCC 43644 / DSM 9630 / IS1B) TaxID=575540 RepID=E8R1F4_ISOPI|nr:enoyl-CoA hydratase/isomerase family protein [Isosphaera pallida]ADV62371.1 Enoyl-CoA hydratase/isomerase [Isosphaera pallida ATCC 43644]
MTAQDSSLVLREYRKTTAVLTLNRPQARNALSKPLLDALLDELAAIRDDHAVRAVVLTGAGPVFCAGLDFKETANEAGEADEIKVVETLRAIADLLDAIHRLPQPTIAALQGDAVAGGCGLASACDLVVASETARLGYPEVQRGMVACMVMQDLVRQVGGRRARELLLTGRLIDARTAMMWGLVNRIAPADQVVDQALEWAAELARNAPEAMATTKKLLDEAQNRPESLRGAAAVAATIRLGAEAREGFLAFQQGRSPHWPAS